MTRPTARPVSPNFSCGPCTKHPGWDLANLKDAVLGRSHRGKLGKDRLKRVIDETKALLELPADYLVGIMPASDTGAVEAALWSLLGSRPVDVFAWESFAFGLYYNKLCTNLQIQCYQFDHRQKDTACVHAMKSLCVFFEHLYPSIF